MCPTRMNRSVAAVAVTAIFVVAVSSAQQAPPATPRVGDPSYRDTVALPDAPQVINTPEQRFRVVPIKGLVHPWGLAFLPDGSMLISERAGRLRIVRNGLLDPQPIGGVPEVLHAGTRGLMDIALHPRFAQNKLVYFVYNKPKPSEPRVATVTLARGRFDGGTALGDVRDLFVADAWTSQTSASRIAFGRDEKIYMTVGVPTRGPVGVQPESAQNPDDHAGKVLRLNDDGSVPDDNPFVGEPGHRPELYALGIRNALALVVHPQTGEIWENENGPQGGDEINIIKPGRNYGWPVISFGRGYGGDLTGSSGPSSAEPCAPGMEQPFITWVPAIAISGMAFYTGDKFPGWKGNVFVGALRGTQLQRVILNGRGLPVRRESLLTELKQRIREVRQGPDGFLYLLTDEDDGAILRIEPV